MGPKRATSRAMAAQSWAWASWAVQVNLTSVDRLISDPGPPKAKGPRRKVGKMRFEDLAVWKRSARLSTREFGFRDQLTRAGLSVPSNIAEGFERESNWEFVNFFSYAKGSCGELRTQIYIGMEIGYINRETGRAWIQESVEISAMPTGLIKTKRAHIADD